MRVWGLLELISELKYADPEDVVVIDAGANSVLLLNTRPGLHQPMDDSVNSTLTEWDKSFLWALGVAPDVWCRGAPDAAIYPTPMDQPAHPEDRT